MQKKRPNWATSQEFAPEETKGVAKPGVRGRGIPTGGCSLRPGEYHDPPEWVGQRFGGEGGNSWYSPWGRGGAAFRWWGGGVRGIPVILGGAALLVATTPTPRFSLRSRIETFKRPISG